MKRFNGGICSANCKGSRLRREPTVDVRALHNRIVEELLFDDYFDWKIMTYAVENGLQGQKPYKCHHAFAPSGRNLLHYLPFTQGVALGWYLVGLFINRSCSAYWKQVFVCSRLIAIFRPSLHQNPFLQHTIFIRTGRSFSSFFGRF